MRFSPFVYFLFCVSLILAADPAPEKAGSSEAVNPALLMALLKPGDVVLRVGDMTLSWGEVRTQALRLVAQNKDDAEQSMQRLQLMFQRLAQRGLYLQEAQARGIVPTPEEKEAYERELEQSLAGNKQGVSKESFIKQFASGSSTLLKLNYEDALKVVKLGNQLLSEVSVTEQEVAQGMAIAKAMQASLRKQNDTKRQGVLAILKDPALQNDEGFASLAREYSEGVEAKQGGELNLNFRRKELAEVNQIDKFDLQPGQTSGLYETDTAFRIVRVLKSIPPEKAGDEERIRVAQLLFKKIPVQADLSREEIRGKILLEKQKKAREQQGRDLQQKYPVQCVLFPDGLW